MLYHLGDLNSSVSFQMLGAERELPALTRAHPREERGEVSIAGSVVPGLSLSLAARPPLGMFLHAPLILSIGTAERRLGCGIVEIHLTGNGARQNGAHPKEEDSWLKPLLWQRAPSPVMMEERWEGREDAGMREAKQTLTSAGRDQEPQKTPPRISFAPGSPGQHCGGLVLGYLLVVKTQSGPGLGLEEEMASNTRSSALHFFVKQNPRGVSPNTPPMGSLNG